ncbi:hypothetical protein [Breoghania sp.]|uniref:hypothetical protein n=1 Tax=Breoghania sp. TaxID=2065378 RepID=UPI002AAA9308|nr:hypothetical protein [Breoghania sp.]
MPKTVVRFSHSEQAIEEAFARWKANDPIAVLVEAMHPSSAYLAGLLEAAGYLDATTDINRGIQEPWSNLNEKFRLICERFSTDVDLEN